ncbi:MAG: MarR family transcriptional regulator [Actinomycetota bacterium]
MSDETTTAGEIDSQNGSKRGQTLGVSVIEPMTDARVRARVGTAWRQIRRGASMVTMKDLFYCQGGEPLDIALADALALICQKGPLRMGELAEHMHITPASTTRAVGCLVDKGFVERVRAEDDQRSIVVTATEAGRERYSEVSRRIQHGLGEILADFSPEEQAQLADYLERFVAAVDKLAETADRD